MEFRRCRSPVPYYMHLQLFIYRSFRLLFGVVPGLVRIKKAGKNYWIMTSGEITESSKKILLVKTRQKKESSTKELNNSIRCVSAAVSIQLFDAVYNICIRSTFTILFFLLILQRLWLHFCSIDFFFSKLLSSHSPVDLSSPFKIAGAHKLTLFSFRKFSNTRWLSLTISIKQIMKKKITPFLVAHQSARDAERMPARQEKKQNIAVIATHGLGSHTAIIQLFVFPDTSARTYKANASLPQFFRWILSSTCALACFAVFQTH